MEEENKEEKLDYADKLKCLIEQELEQITNTELNANNLDVVGKLIDIQKDLENIDYWNVKKEVMKMRYNNYGDYAEERYGNYGRRGVPGTGRGRYRGHDDGDEMIEDMHESYSAYSESRNAYNRGNYSAGQDSMKALDDTMELFVEFTEKMVHEAETPEAKQIIRKHLRKISQMGDM